MNKSDSIKELASALSKAQAMQNIHAEAILFKRFTNRGAFVNANSAPPMPDRFFSKVMFGASDCWYWVGCVDDIGYGRFPYKGENKAHRVSWLISNGEIPAGLKVLHKCDVRSCVNPDHLFLGTQADNVKDMVDKGRNVYISQPGEKNPMSKLTYAEVNDIRAIVLSGEYQNKVARLFSVSPMTISRIIRRESWK